PGVEMEPRVSPDGRFIAYLATRRDITTIDSVAEDAHAWVIPFAGGAARELNGELDRRTGNIEWMPDLKRILYTAADHGSTLLCTSPLDAAKASCEIGRAAQAASPAVAADGSVTFTLSTPESPAEIYRLDANAQKPRQLTKLNYSFTAQHKLSKPEV